MYQSIKRWLFPRIVAQTGRLESSQTAQLTRWNLHKMTSFRSICSTKSGYPERPFPRSVYRPLVMPSARGKWWCHPYRPMMRPVESLSWVSPVFPAKCWDIVLNSATADTFHVTGDQLHWSTKILAHEEKCLFLVYFLGAEFEYVSRISLSPTPFALRQTMWPHTRTYVSHWGPVGLVWTCCNKPTLTCHTRVINNPLQVAEQRSVCYRLRNT